MKFTLDRRQFLSSLAATAAGGVILPRISWGEPAASGAGASLVVVQGTDVDAMVAAGIAKMGGWKAFVKPGKKAVIKPNAAWASLPEQGGNTSPGLVAKCVKDCLAAGASEVVVPEYTCSPSKVAFSRSGIEDAVAKAGGRMYAADKPEYFQKVQIPKGVNLKESEVVKDLLDCPCIINMPVAKSHSGAVLTLSLKNWMGSARERGSWHRNNLHQCIADFNTFMKAHLVIIDAIRIMTTNGPQGPCPADKLGHPNQIIFGTDPVAADAYAATLFGKKPFDVPYIKLAHEMGVGCGDLALIKIEHVKV